MKFKILIITLLSAISMSMFANAQDSIGLNVMGTDITDKAEVLNVDGRIMVPLRAIFESIGANVEWNGETKTITGTKDNNVVIMQIDNKGFALNNEQKTMDVAPFISDGKTYVPVRYVAESLGCEVEWTNSPKTVNIKSKSTETTEITTETSTEVTTITETSTETTTISETTIETTTEIYLKDINHTLKEQIKSDIKTAIGNYSLGNARNLNRYKDSYKKELFERWAAFAKTDEDKIFLEKSKAFYNNSYSVMIKIDNLKNNFPKDENVFYMYSHYKDKIKQLYADFANCEKMSDVIEIIKEFNTIKTEIDDYIKAAHKS
jgi:hypothetical protein